MPQAAALPVRLVAFTDADWTEDPFQFFLGTYDGAEDFTGASAVLALRLVGGTVNAAEFTSGNGELAIALPNRIAITANKTQMAAFAPGLYGWELVVTYASGAIEALLTGQAQINQGLT